VRNNLYFNRLNDDRDADVTPIFSRRGGGGVMQNTGGGGEQVYVKRQKMKEIKKPKKTVRFATVSVCQRRPPTRKKGGAAVKSEKSGNCEMP
jgi:hypothetical protein